MKNLKNYGPKSKTPVYYPGVPETRAGWYPARLMSSPHDISIDQSTRPCPSVPNPAVAFKTQVI